MRSIFLSLLTIFTVLLIQRTYSQDKLYVNTFPLSDVKLLDGPFKHAQDLNVNALLQYDVDRLLAPYLKEAGLTPKGQSFDNWLGLDGHIGGHYLSAMAIHYASSGNAECKQRMDYIIDQLLLCQEANASDANFIGYLGGVPDGKSIWLEIMNGKPLAIRNGWVPLYNIHKMYAGLRDAWLYGESDTAQHMFLKFCDWGISLTEGLSDAQMEQMLDTEHGGMNEIFADAYQITGDEKYLVAAKRFSHKFLLNPLSIGTDNLDNLHANTQVPKAVGFARIGELTGDTKYTHAGSFFWETVTGNRSLAFGGNSRQEFFPPSSACVDYINSVEGPESCNTNNMLKLTEDLFFIKPMAKYADYYEKALYNHILSTQHPDHGGYVYFTPARPRHYRVYSAPNKAMWCCVGTGMENHGKYGEFIYTHRNDSLFVNLFVASELNWQEKGLKIIQETQFPYSEKTKLRVTEGSAPLKIMLRYPEWVSSGTMEVTVNGVAQTISAVPSSYFSIDRTWSAGDSIEIILPMHNSLVQLPNVPQYKAFMHGPILLGAKTGTEDLNGLIANDQRWAHIASGKILPINEAPMIIEDNLSNIAEKLVPVEGKPLRFIAPELNIANANDTIEFEPFYQIHDARYMMYWMALTEEDYNYVLDSITNAEDEKIALQNRTLDFIQPGQQQPEADHYMQSSKSNSGTHMNEFWRDANNDGYFSYQLSTNGETNLSLMVRYWGNESGNRSFDILIDDQVLVSENLIGKWDKQEFFDVEYSIPNLIIEGKSKIRVKFQAPSSGTAGGVFYIRLLRLESATPIKKKILSELDEVIIQGSENTIVVSGLKKSANIAVFNLQGSMINTEYANSDFVSINIPSGMYLIRIGSKEEGVITRKVCVN